VINQSFKVGNLVKKNGERQREAVGMNTDFWPFLLPAHHGLPARLLGLSFSLCIVLEHRVLCIFHELAMRF
jgi:hypothetical protein